MTTPSEKECVANTEGNQKQDYQNYGKTHIFFGVECERGTHPQPPMPNAIASVERVIVCKQSNPAQSPYQRNASRSSAICEQSKQVSCCPMCP